MSLAYFEGYTHPHIPFKLFPLWKRFMCKKNMHLFDEVATFKDNYFVCDACDLYVFIDVNKKEFE